MIIKWYNRDAISDVELRQARLVADRLRGIKSPVTVDFPPVGAYFLEVDQSLWNKSKNKKREEV